MKNPLSRKEHRESVKYSVYEGMAANAAEGATDDYYVPYALAAGASLAQVGWLVTLQQVLAAFCYLKLSNFAGVLGSRKRAILILVLTDAITFLPFIILPFIFRDHLVEGVFVFYVLAAIPGVVAAPIWASWITDLVPAAVRGRYFGMRSTITGSANLAFFIIAGLVLNYFTNSVFEGFAIVFGFAAFARLISWLFFRKIRDIPIAAKEAAVSFGLSDFTQALGYGRFGKYMVYSSLFYFAGYLSTPFFAAFMLQDLKLTYLMFMVLICSQEIGKLLLFRFWGRYADAAGNLRVVKIAAFILPAVPVLWLVSHNIVYLVCVQVIAGVAWAGFELCSPNFVYSALPQGNRIKYIACFRALNGLAMALGALVGGYLATRLPPFLGHPLLALFLLSGVLRALVSFRMLPSIVDVARKKSWTVPYAYKVRPTPVSRASDNADWGLLYARMGANIGHALGAKHVLATAVGPEHRGLFYDKHAIVPLEIKQPRRRGGDKRPYNNFRVLRSMALPTRQSPAQPGRANPDSGPKGLFYARVWQSVKNFLKAGDAPATLPSSEKPALLHKTDAWGSYLPPPRETPINVIRAEPEGGPLLHNKQAWPTPGEAAGPAPAGAKPPAAGPGTRPALLHDPKAWDTPGAVNDAATPADKPKREALLHNPEAWDAPDAASGAAAPGDKPRREALLHNPKAWDAPDAASGAAPTGDKPRREPLLHNPKAWDVLVPKEAGPADAQNNPPKGRGSARRQPLVPKPEKWPAPDDKGPKDAPSAKPPSPRKGLLHQPEAWAQPDVQVPEGESKAPPRPRRFPSRRNPPPPADGLK